MKAALIRVFLLWMLLLYGTHQPALSQPYEVKAFLPLSTHGPCDSNSLRIRYEAGTRVAVHRIPYWDSLLGEAQACRFSLYEARILETIANIHGAANNLPQAIIYAEKALAVTEARGDRAGMIPLLKRLERLSALQLDRKRSLYFIYKGLQLAEELKDNEAIVDFYSFLGLYYYTAGEIDKALKIHYQCLQYCKSIGYDFGVSSALVDLGTDYSYLKQPEKSARFYLESRRYLGKLEGTIYAVQIYTSLSTVYTTQHKYDSAYYYTYKALRIAERIGSRIAMASSLNILAGIDYNTGHLAAAKEHALRALKLSQETNFMAQMPGTLSVLRTIYLKEGNYKDAMKTYEHYVAINDSFSNERIRKQAMEKEYMWKLERKENEYKLLSQSSQIQSLRLSQQRYLAGGLTGLLIVILIIVYLVMRHRKIRSEHQRVQLEQKLLRSQMNPHFLFNSMNSIQQLIMSGDNRPAELYLSRFSRLIRDLLESNTRESLTIREEADMLEAYLQMESLRFGNNFCYTIAVDERVDTQQTHIPHLMIQPFVENAIWHGLLAKEHDRNLQISFEYDNRQTIRCVVDDNGVGRTTRKLRTNSPRKKSLALDLVRQRIDLIRKTYKITGSVEIIDKKDAADRPLGTTVVLILPILN